MSTNARIAVFALVALLVAGGVTWAASRLVSERIGLSGEPLSAGEGLAPNDAHKASGPGGGSESQRRRWPGQGLR